MFWYLNQKCRPYISPMIKYSHLLISIQPFDRLFEQIQELDSISSDKSLSPSSVDTFPGKEKLSSIKKINWDNFFLSLEVRTALLQLSALCLRIRKWPNSSLFSLVSTGETWLADTRMHHLSSMLSVVFVCLFVFSKGPMLMVSVQYFNISLILKNIFGHLCMSLCFFFPF